MKESNFYEKVYVLCKKIPKGRVSTYKLLGDALHTKAYRAVGQALKCNPDAPRIPCHRVVASNGTLYGFKGKMEGKALNDKRKLLEGEGVKVIHNKIADFDRVLYTFK